MNYDEFIENQNKIYNEFKDISKIENEGLKPNIQENKGGYIIALRHPNNIVNNINNISSKIYKKIDCIKYNERNIHTTVVTYNECIGFKVNDDELELLCNIAERNIALIRHITIKYNECLINQDSVIVAGTADKGFVEYIDAIEMEAKIYGKRIKKAWGAHITIGRFLNNVSNEKIKQLLNIIVVSNEIGVSKPLYIDIGYYILGNGEFNLSVYKSIEL